MRFRNFLFLCCFVLFGCDEAEVCVVDPQKSPELLEQQWAQKVPLKGGLSAATVDQVSDGKTFYVLRVMKDRRLEDKMREIKAQQVASDAGYGPKLIAYDLDKGTVLMEYLKPSVTAMFVDELPQKLAALLHQIHDGPAFCEGKSILDQLVQRYEVALVFPPDIDRTRVGDEIAMLLKERTGLKKPTHRDLNPNNFIWQGDSFKVIDFENAAQDDPFFDIATVLLFHLHDDHSRKAFLKAYFQRELSADEKAHLDSMHKVVCLFYGLGLMSHASLDMIEDSKETQSLQDIFDSLFKKGAFDLSQVSNQLIFAKALIKEAITE